MAFRERWHQEAYLTRCVDNRHMLTYSSSHRL